MPNSTDDLAQPESPQVRVDTPSRQWRFLTTAATGFVVPSPQSLSFDSRPTSSMSLLSSKLAALPGSPRLASPRAGSSHGRPCIDVTTRSLPGRLTRDRVVLDRRLLQDDLSGGLASVAPGYTREGLAIEDMQLIPAPPTTSKTLTKTRGRCGAQPQRRQLLPWNEPANNPLAQVGVLADGHNGQVSTFPINTLDILPDVGVMSLEASQTEENSRKVRFATDEQPTTTIVNTRRRGSFREPHGSDSAPQQLGRRSSRALFLERMDILKRTLESTVDDVTDAFEFDKNPDQLRSLKEVVKGVDGAVLGQEYPTAHPMQPTLSLVGRTNAQMDALVSSMKRPAPAASSSHNSNVATRSYVRSVSSRATSPPESPGQHHLNVLGRQETAYYLQVAEERRKTGASASGNQLYIAAEELEERNGAHLRQLLPKHDQAIDELGLLGLV